MCRETCWVRDASGVTSVPQCAFLCLDVGAAFVWSQRQWLINNKKYQEGADEEKRHNLLNNNARIQCTRALWFSHFRDWQPTEQHFTCYKNIANLSKDREKVCRSYPGTWSRQIFKPLANCFSKPSFSCHCSLFHHCYLYENGDSESNCKEDEVWLVFGSLTVARNRCSILLPARWEEHVETWKFSNSEYGQENSFLKENVENHCNRCSFYLKDEFGDPEAGWLDPVPNGYQSTWTQYVGI